MSSPAAPAHGSPHTITGDGVAATVTTTGRLHLGFFDPGASLGRRFGSLGLVIEDLATTLELAPAAQDRLAGHTRAARAELPRLADWLGRLRDASGHHAALSLTLRDALPAHAGFGSGTQLALALGRAFAAVHDLAWSTGDIALLLGRGGRSGIGIAGFDRGGLLVDGGPRDAAHVPPLLARMDFPADWRIVLCLDTSRIGLHGDAEREALRRLPPFPRHLAAELCHLVLMQILPAAAERDFAPFAQGIGQLQRTIGHYFAPAQGGLYASPAVSRVLDWMTRQGTAGVGQSSWGPTGFAIVPSAHAAGQLVADARAAGVADAVTLRIVRGRNEGATLARGRRAAAPHASCATDRTAA